MTEQPVAERRKHQRYPLSTSVEFHHGPSQRDFLGRCVDVSSGGMRLFVPPGAPVQAGHPIRLNAGSVNRPELGLVGENPVSGTITRVDRAGLVPEGHLAVGVRFSIPTA
jgi:PilZ domain